MAKSTAKSEAMARDLKDRLEFRGFTVAESKDGNGFPKLTLNTDESSILITDTDAVSKDVFGNDLRSFAPHRVEWASREDAIGLLEGAQILMELNKIGIDKTIVKTHATVLATAEATVGTEVVADVRWPTKGI